MQERRPTRRARRRGRKRTAFGIAAIGLVVFAHYQLAALENASMASLEQSSAAKKIGAMAAQSAARSATPSDTRRQNIAGKGYKDIRKADPVSLPGPTAAGMAMQLSGSPALQARFRQLQKETARALNTASNEGSDLSALRTPMPAIIESQLHRRDVPR